MTDFSFLIPPAIAFLVAAGSPGPATLATAATAMALGRHAGLQIALGLGAGLTFWGLVAAAGFGSVVLAWTPALLLLKIGGGAFLLWLAWKSAKSALSARNDPLPQVSAGGLVRRGFLLNLLNPKAVLAWGAVIAIGLPTGAGTIEIAQITAVCIALGFAVYAIYALSFSLPPVMACYARTRRWVDAGCAAFFALAGIRLLTWRAGP